MNKINALHLFGAALLAALFMLYLAAATERRIADAEQENARMEALGQKVRGMKESWDDGKQMQRRIDTLLSQREFKPYVGKSSKSAKTYRVQIDEIPSQPFDRFMTKLMNAPVAISKLTVTRNGDQNVSLDLEFAL